MLIMGCKYSTKACIICSIRFVMGCVESVYKGIGDHRVGIQDNKQ